MFRLFQLLPLSAFFWVSSLAWAPPDHPVILVTIDTLRADHLPMWGASEVRTPNLEALARRGVVFEQAVTTAPLTLPAHVSLMTGTYPHFHQVRDNSAARLSPKIPTLARVLKGRGYRTAAFVSSAVLDRRYGLDQGFDHYGDQFGVKALFTGHSAERNAEAVVQEAIQWMRGGSSQRVFAWLHLYDPHAPYSAPGELAKRGYKGEIEYVDRQLGTLFAFLTEKGWDRTALILVLSDHGEDLNQHGEPTHGFFVYDTVLRIPLIVKLPEDEHGGRRVAEQVRIIDVFPTILQILRMGMPKDSRSQGTGLLSSLLGRTTRRRDAYAESLYPNLHFGWSSLFTLRTERYKYIEAPRPELYDLRHDPGETRNILESNQGIANQMKDRLSALRARFEGEQAPQVAMDAEQRERLMSLGYLSGSTAVRLPPENEGLADPKDKARVYSRVYRGMQAFLEGDYTTSLQHLVQARGLDDSTALVHDYIGRVLSRLNRPDEAVDSYKKALRLSPGDYQASSNLAFAYLQAGKPKEAAQGLELLIRLNPSDWQAHYLLGVSRVQLGDASSAADAFETSLRHNPNEPDTLFNLGAVYEGQRMHLKAVEVFRKLVQIAPRDSGAWNSLATSYEGAALSRQAEEAYRKAIEADPANAVSYFNYGNFFARARQWAQAERMYRQVIAKAGDFAQAYLTLAVVLEQQGKTAEAARFREEGQRLKKP